MQVLTYKDIKHRKAHKRIMMLCTVSYTGIEASGVLYQTLLGLTEGGHVERGRKHKLFIEFYKFFVTE